MAHALTGSQMFEDIQATSESGEYEIVIRLVSPAQLVRFSPQRPSDTLEIQLSLSPASSTGLVVGARESVPWKPTPDLPLSDIQFEQTGSANGRITVHFRKDLAFKVTPADDARSFIVTATDPSFSAAEAGTAQSSSGVNNKGNAAKANGSGPATNLELARDAVVREDWSGVIAYYSKVLLQPEEAQQYPEAHEMLGLARERMGQPFYARQEYTNYLKLYPKGEGAKRVNQRLAGLDSATSKAKAKLGADKQGLVRDTAPISQFNGGISQYYYQDGRFSDTKGVTRNTSLLLNNVYLNGRLRTDRYDLRGRFDARYRENFLNEANRQFRISNFYIDAQDRVTGLMTRLGRQMRSTGGVLGRFDGGVVGYRFSPQWQAVAVGGFPVQPFRSTSVDTSTSFYGFSLEMGPFYDVWAGNVYFINQDTKGLSVPDRRAIGGELRYQDSVHPTFSQIDYDIFLNELNIAQLQSSWNFEGGAILQANFDYRRVPIASNSFTYDLLRYGTPGSISDSLFQQVLTDSLLQQAAKLNSSVMTTFTLGGILPLSKKYQLNADLMISDLSGSNDLANFMQNVVLPKLSPFLNTLDYPYSAYFNGVGVQGSGLQMSYTTQLIGNSMLSEGDVWTLGFRYTDNSSIQNILSMYVDSQYPITSDIRLAPRIRVDYYDAGRGFNSAEMVRIRPAMRFNYRVMKALNVELEGGYEWNNNKDKDSVESNSYYFTAGYRLDF